MIIKPAGPCRERLHSPARNPNRKCRTEKISSYNMILTDFPDERGPTGKK